MTNQKPEKPVTVDVEVMPAGPVAADPIITAVKNLKTMAASIGHSNGRVMSARDAAMQGLNFHEAMVGFLLGHGNELIRRLEGAAHAQGADLQTGVMKGLYGFEACVAKLFGDAQEAGVAGDLAIMWHNSDTGVVNQAATGNDAIELFAVAGLMRRAADNIEESAKKQMAEGKAKNGHKVLKPHSELN